MTRTVSDDAVATRFSTDFGTAPISVVLIEDNRLLREGLAALIHTRAGFRVLAAEDDAIDVIAKIMETRPDIILLDFGLTSRDSLELTSTAREAAPFARIIVMGLLVAQEDVADYVRAGASGFIMKDASFEEFFATIREVARGVQVLPTQLTSSLFSQILRNAPNKLRRQARDAVRITAREREVIDALGQGLSNKEIAATLHIAVHTVKSHVHNVLEKLALHSRLEIAAYAHSKRRDTSGGE